MLSSSPLSVSQSATRWFLELSRETGQEAIRSLVHECARVKDADEPPAYNLTDLLFVEPRIGGQVDAVEITHKRKARQPDAHLDTALIPASDLVFSEHERHLANVTSRRPRLIDQAAELIVDRGRL